MKIDIEIFLCKILKSETRKRLKKFICIVFCICCLQPVYAQFQSSVEKNLEAWKDARFGMFIHWGPVSLKGTEIGWSRGDDVSIEEYDNLYKQFNPVKFNAGEWVKIAKDAGMKYLVFTTKHHDGFCMWDTQYSSYNIMNTPFARDVVRELADSCKKYDMALGLYHSTCDWLHPDFPRTSPRGGVRREVHNLDRYTEYLKNQSAELVENYGPVLLMWYDMPQEFDTIRGQSVIDRIREIQPSVLVNDRTGAKGDFDTPEQGIGEYKDDRPWESCMTIARQWAWKPNDEVKTLEQCIQGLVRSAGGNGNLLFNVGPKPDGTIEAEQVERLRQMGDWLKKYGHTIYETRGGPLKPSDWGVSTRKGNKIFLHILNWIGNDTQLVVPSFGAKIESCQLLTGGDISFTKQNDNYILQFSIENIDPINTIIELSLDKNVMELAAIEAIPQVISYNKPVTSSSNPDARFNDKSSVNNGNWVGCFWKPSENDKKPWIEIDLEIQQCVSKALIYESGNEIKEFELQYKKEGSWKTLHTGTKIGEKLEVNFAPIQLQQLRLVINKLTGIPGIYEIIIL